MTRSFLPYGRQQVDGSDIEAVTAALGDRMLTQGPRVESFEQAICEYTGAAHAVAMSSGTAALHAAAFSLGVGPDDSGLVPAITFAASANCLRYLGAQPRIVDIDAGTLNIDAGRAADAVSAGTGTKAIVPVSFAGLPVDLDPLRELGIPIIEDACHALGATRDGVPVGGPGGADATVFSLHPVKAITAGEGGIVTTDDPELATRIRRFREHGIEREPDQADGPWSYDIVQEGFNYRVTDFQCALAESQLSRLDRWIEERNELADLYRTLLSDEPEILLPPAAPEGSRHAYHLFAIQIRRGAFLRRRVFEGLRSSGVGVQVHYIPLHRLTRFSECPRDDCAVAERYYDGAISLPIFPGLSTNDVRRVVDELRRLIRVERF